MIYSEVTRGIGGCCYLSSLSGEMISERQSEGGGSRWCRFCLKDQAPGYSPRKIRYGVRPKSTHKRELKKETKEERKRKTTPFAFSCLVFGPNGSDLPRLTVSID